MTPEAALRVLVDVAAERFRLSGRFAYFFARGKLRTDPVFTTLLAQPLPRGCLPRTSATVTVTGRRHGLHRPGRFPFAVLRLMRMRCAAHSGP